MPFLIRTAVHYLEWTESYDQFTFFLLIFLFSLILTHWVFSTTFSTHHHPPGPKGLPLVGYIPFMKKNNTHLQLDRLAKYYGSVFRLKLGICNLVVLADYESMSDALKRDAFSARPLTPFTDFFDGCGIVNTSGEAWKKQRRFGQDAMRKFGVHLNKDRNRDPIQEVINREIETLIDAMMKQDNGDIDLHLPLATCTANVIADLLMKVRFDGSDQQFHRLLHLIDEGFQLFSVIAPVNFVPALQYVPIVRRAHRTLIKNRDEVFRFFDGIIDAHKKSYVQGSEDDFIDIYLTQLSKEEPNIEKKKCNEKQLYQILADLLTSGMETTRVTLQWFLLYMAANQDILKKVQKEMDSVIGRDRLPQLNDMGTLPYLEACILETQRISNVIAIAPAHATNQDTTVSGFFVPRGSIIFPLLYSVHTNEKYFKNAKTFDPTRFLSPDGSSVQRDPHFIPFGIGRRQCLGLVLARMELFCIAANVLHKFDVALPSGCDFSKMVPVTTTTVSPPAHKISISSRY